MLTKNGLILFNILLILVLAACKEGSSYPDEKIGKDTSISKDKDARIAPANDTLKLPISDIAVPYIAIRVTPQHMTTGLERDTKITLHASYNRVDPAALEKEITSAVSLLTWPGKKLVPTSFTLYNYSHTGTRNGNLRPDNLLVEGAEYLVHVNQSGLIHGHREYSQFRVGPLTRVPALRFLPSSQDPDFLQDINIVFTGNIDQNTVFQATKITNSSTSKAISMTPNIPENQGISVRGATLRFPHGQKMTDKLSITIGIDLGGPLLLDGQYTGKAGSGPFQLEIVPQDTCTSASCEWVPELSY